MQTMDKENHKMKRQLRLLGFVLILIGLALSASFISGGVTPTESVGPQGQVGPDMAGVGPGGGNVMIFGIDWIYVVASGLVLIALAAGLAIGRGPRRKIAGH
jgi:hypothetical protein